MPEPTKIPRPFADSGDKNSIPDSSGGLGFASWQEGFPAITGTPFAQGGVAPKRADFNGVFNALSAATIWAQQGGVYAYDATTDYEVGNIVEYNNDLYKCITANGPSSTVKAPTDTTVWSLVMTAADAAANYLAKSTITTGTWTPVIRGATTAGTYTGTTYGTYYKIGNLVYILGSLGITWSTSPNGQARLTGLPYTVKNANTGIYFAGTGTSPGATRISDAVCISGQSYAVARARNLSGSTADVSSFASSESGYNIVGEVGKTMNLTITGCYLTD